jgi:hypothetical protein
MDQRLGAGPGHRLDLAEEVGCRHRSPITGEQPAGRLVNGMEGSE